MTEKDIDKAYEDLENFFIEEGQWLEGQLKSEDYEGCPVCSHMVECLKHLHEHLQDIFKATDALQEEDRKPEAISLMSISKLWYLLYKEDFLEFIRVAHLPDKVMKAHPETAISKGQKRKIRSGKNLRKHARKRARR